MMSPLRHRHRYRHRGDSSRWQHGQRAIDSADTTVSNTFNREFVLGLPNPEKPRSAGHPRAFSRHRLIGHHFAFSTLACSLKLFENQVSALVAK